MIKHLIIEWPKSNDIWLKMKAIGLNIKVTEKAVMNGIVDQVAIILHHLYWLIVCTVNSTEIVWKTRCKMVIHQSNISANNVLKQILNYLKKA